MSSYHETFRLAPWVLAYAVGIGLHKIWSPPSVVAIILVLLVTVLLGVGRLRHALGALWTACAFFLLISFGWTSASRTSSATCSSHELLEVLDMGRIKGRFVQYECRSVLDECRGLILIASEKAQPEIGEIIRVEGDESGFNESVFPFEFDEVRYAESKGWTFRLWCWSWEKVRPGAIPVRWQLNSRIDEWPATDRTKGFYKALLLGSKTDIASSDKANFSNAGLVHILAVSGLHVGLIAWMLQFIVGKLLPKKWRWIQVIFVISGLWGFAWIAGMSSSVVRAALLFSLIQLARLEGREARTSEAVWMAGFIILAFDPSSLFDLGFQLSFMAVFGIVYGHSQVQRLFFNELKFVKRRIFEALSVSFWAQLATTPFTLFYFHQFPNYFLLSNLLLLPLIPILLCVGIVALMIQYLWNLPLVFWRILDWVIDVFFSLVHWIAHWPGAVTEGVFPSVLQSVTLVVLLILTFLILHTRIKTWLYVLPIFALGLISFESPKSGEVYHFNYRGLQGIEVWHGDSATVFLSDTSQWSKVEYATRVWHQSARIKFIHLKPLPQHFEPLQTDTLFPLSSLSPLSP
ncbi:MAG: ComEC/Rec2 family competence protein [Flavobacteriia bacterium]|nr:ComEC/Rec2 family competence protein [Flavobacteriia bacterium]